LRNGSPAMANRALPGPVDYPQIPELAQRGVARISQFLVTLSEQLSAHEFVAGASFSVADITACVAVDFARVVKVKPDERHPHLLRWRAQLGQRPAFAL
jgi:glutathione S-transferase